MIFAMSTPSTFIYVRPGSASYTWSYAGNTLPSGASSSPVTAVSFDAASAPGQAASRGDLQYSADNGKTWATYALPVDGQGPWVAANGTLWRFQDHASGDSTTPDSFNAHYQLLDGSVATAVTTVLADSQPVGLTGSYDTLFSTMAAGDVVDLLYGIDTGAQTGGRWVIDSQSVPGLFGIAYNPALDTSGKLVVANPSLLPASGQAAAVTVHYYDRYQVDAGGNPIANTGVTRTLNYTVEDGSTRDLAGFADESKLGAATAAASPALAKLSTGGIVAVWQAADSVAGGAGAGLWAQLRDAAGNPLGGAFALTPDGDARLEGQPAVSSLAGGRFAVAYALGDGGASKIAYRVVEANGAAGVEHVVDLGASGDAAMPAVTTLADGSFAVGWRSSGAVHVQQAAADGALVGGEQIHGALGSAYSPSLAALQQGGYVVSWGEINDGNVYAAMQGGAAAGTPFVVNGDGYAASVSTAAPLPHLSALANGGFVVAWDSYANDPHGFSISDIYYQVYDGAGHATGPISQANVESGGGRYDAAVAALSDGGFVITWQGEDGDGNGIFGRRFGAGGAALDQHEFAVSQLRAGDQSTPDVVALANGGFATAWLDSAAGGNTSVEARVLQGLAGPSVVLEGSAHGADSGSAPAETAPATTAPSASVPAAPPVSITGSAARDALLVPAGNSVLDGGSGLDTAVFGGVRAAYTVHKDGSGFAVDGLDGSHAVLANVERIQFADQMVGLDINGIGGQAFRLYQAAFARTPDLGGLGYWIGVMDNLGQSLEKAATGFVNSQEFADRYGANPTDSQFVQALYQNVLHRGAEGAGYDFWMNSLTIESRAQVLSHFSESAENQANVVGSIQNGFDYIHYG
jgi:hypothetical protein